MGLSRDITRADVGKFYVTRNGRVAVITGVEYLVQTAYPVTACIAELGDLGIASYTPSGCYYTDRTPMLSDLVEGPFTTVKDALPVAALLED